METAAIKATGTNKYTPFTRRLTAVYTRATLEVTQVSRPTLCVGLISKGIVSGVVQVSLLQEDWHIVSKH